MRQAILELQKQRLQDMAVPAANSQQLALAAVPAANSPQLALAATSHVLPTTSSQGQLVAATTPALDNITYIFLLFQSMQSFTSYIHI